MAGKLTPLQRAYLLGYRRAMARMRKERQALLLEDVSLVYLQARWCGHLCRPQCSRISGSRSAMAWATCCPLFTCGAASASRRSCSCRAVRFNQPDCESNIAPLLISLPIVAHI